MQPAVRRERQRHADGRRGADYLSGGTSRTAPPMPRRPKPSSSASPTRRSIRATPTGDTYQLDREPARLELQRSALNGNSASNAINGAAGNDTIKGYAGNDTLTGDTGRTSFVFNTALNASTNVDTITDFNVAADTIQLDNAIFTAPMTAGALASAAFRANATGLAADASDRIIYKTDTGELYYDANGSASGGGVLFAKVGTGLAHHQCGFRRDLGAPTHIVAEDAVVIRCARMLTHRTGRA